MKLFYKALRVYNFENNLSSQSGTDTLHGMGVDYALSSKLLLRGEYTEYGANDSATNLGLLKLVYRW